MVRTIKLVIYYFLYQLLFTTLRSVLNDNLGIFYCFSINFPRFSLHYSKLSLLLHIEKR